MTKNQENKLSMYLTVQQVTNFHSNVWEGINAFKNFFNKYESILHKISETRLIQEKKITGVTKDKQTARNKATEKVLIISDAVYAYASEIGDYKTADRVSYRMKDFVRGRDTIIIDRLNVIHEAAAIYLDELEDYDVTQADLDESIDLTKTYKSVIESPRQAITNRSRATKELEALISDTDTVLKNRLDRLVNRFKSSHPEFWQQYKNARKIINMGHRKRKSEDVAQLVNAV